MRFIAHRGNVEGPSKFENSPSQIDWCLNRSIDCEVDLWVEDETFKLGHDFGQYEITEKWLLERMHGLWIHCKNSEALKTLVDFHEPDLNFFWHQEDSYTLTSRNFIWVYPGKVVPPGSISVLPENWITVQRSEEVALGFGVCTDYVLRYKEKFDGAKF